MTRPCHSSWHPVGSFTFCCDRDGLADGRARVSLRGGVRLLRGFHVGRGDARARRRRTPSRRVCFYAEKLIVARKRFHGALTELSELQRRASHAGFPPKQFAEIAARRGVSRLLHLPKAHICAHPGLEPAARARRRQFEWCDMKQARRECNVLR